MRQACLHPQDYIKAVKREAAQISVELQRPYVPVDDTS